MKRIVALCFMFFCALAHATFIGSTDVPLMDGMEINENDGFSFDTPSGQIMTISAHTKASVQEVKSFYQNTLAELGWQKKNNTTYHRDQDELVLQVVSASKGSNLKIQFTFANK